MWIYATVVTAIAVILFIRCKFYKKAVSAALLFAEEHYRKPTKEEIDYYSKKVIVKSLRRK